MERKWKRVRTEVVEIVPADLLGALGVHAVDRPDGDILTVEVVREYVAGCETASPWAPLKKLIVRWEVNEGEGRE